MNTTFKLLISASLAMLWITSCDNSNEISKPEVNLTELGYQNSKMATLGNDLHIEAEILAEGKIESIQVTIHPEGEHEKKGSEIANHEDEWEFDSLYTTGFNGVKNATFHKHVDIPATADTGVYHFHFIVTDMEGNQTTVEDEITIAVEEDTEAPIIVVSSAPSEGQVFSNEQTISISGNITDNLFLGGCYIGLVRTDQNLEDAAVNATNTITLLHTHEFDSPLSFTFSASIIVGAASDNNSPAKDISGNIAWSTGNYYILVKSTDAFGGNWSYSIHYPIEIKL